MATPEASSDTASAPRRASRTARRIGHVLAVVVNVALAVVVNWAPGWQALSVLTDAFVEVLPFVNASLAAGVVVHLAAMVADPPWAGHVGDAVTAAFALAVLIRFAVVFPLDLGTGWAGWETALRVVIGLGGVGAGIGIVAGLVEAVRAASGTGGDDRASG